MVGVMFEDPACELLTTDVEKVDAMLEDPAGELSSTAVGEVDVRLEEPAEELLTTVIEEVVVVPKSSTTSVVCGPIPSPQIPTIVGFPDSIRVIVALGTQAVVTISNSLPPDH